MAGGPTVYLDAMGGDFAPEMNVAGAVQAVLKNDLHVVLVGDESKVRPVLETSLKKNDLQNCTKISIEHTDEFISMDEHPSTAVRTKRRASINIAMKLAADTPKSAFLSAGNSGAALASSVMFMKRIPGVERPAIVATLPAINGYFFLVDAGANTQCRASQLVQFSLLGSAYYRHKFPGKIGKIGILSNGSEESKGTDLTRETHAILAKIQSAGLLPPNVYKGYIEGKRIFSGDVDVVVCDGFTGNILLKGLEGITSALSGIVRQELKKDWLGALAVIFARRALRKVKVRLDYAEVGAAPLIGVNGHAFIAHGGSTIKAMKNAVLEAAAAADSDLPQVLAEIVKNTKEFVSQAGPTQPN